MRQTIIRVLIHTSGTLLCPHRKQILDCANGLLLTSAQDWSRGEAVAVPLSETPYKENGISICATVTLQTARKTYLMPAGLVTLQRTQGVVVDKDYG